MSFDLFFFALGPPKPSKALQALVEEAVESAGGRVLRQVVDGCSWENVEAESGSTFEWYGPDPLRHGQTGQGGGMAALRGLDLQICRCLYAIAARTDWVMVPAMDDTRSMRAKESRALPLHEGMPELLVIEGAQELLTFLGSGYGAWQAYRDQVVDNRN